MVVIGLGGVGSHTAHLLLRCGVRRMRLVDFDQVTLSSLNRHATAVRADVGNSKAVALRNALLRIDPSCELEAIVSLFDDAAAARLLAGRPALVVDAIDDLATKAALLGHCVRLDLPVVSALGAGGKADACALHVGRLSEVFNDPIAASMLKRLRKQKQQTEELAKLHATEQVQEKAEGGGAGKEPASTVAAQGGSVECPWWEEMAHRVTVVYSSEQQRVSLLPLPEGSSASDLGSQPNFRVRVMPVLPALPAAVGAAVAAHALAQLGGTPIVPVARPVPALSPSYMTRLYRTFQKHELKELKRPPGEMRLAFHETALIVCDVFRCRCALTGRRLHDPARPTFCLVRFDARRAADAGNVLFAITDAAKKHEAEGIDALPVAVRAQIERTIAMGLAGRRTCAFQRSLT